MFIRVSSDILQIANHFQSFLWLAFYLYNHAIILFIPYVVSTCSAFGIPALRYVGGLNDEEEEVFMWISGHLGK